MTLFTTPSLPDLADALDKSIEDIASDVYKLAMYLESIGNRGVSRHALVQVQMPVYFLTDVYLGIWRDILFFAEGSRKRDFDGWGLRRRPHDWRIAWGERFGWSSDIGQQLIEEAHAAALVEYEAKRVRRHNETFAQGRYEEYTSEQIAYRMAVADILMCRYSHMYHTREKSRDWHDNAHGYSMRVWMQQNQHMQKELEYRTKAEPEARSSKAKTEAARADFAHAKKFLDAGTGYFFSLEFVQQAIESAEEPDLTVDFDHLPKLTTNKTPVRWLTNGQLIAQFMAFLAESNDPQSFEYEDARKILDTLRKMLARAKGQKISDNKESLGE